MFDLKKMGLFLINDTPTSLRNGPFFMNDAHVLKRMKNQISDFLVFELWSLLYSTFLDN